MLQKNNQDTTEKSELNGNIWLNGMKTCPNCGADLRKMGENWEKETGCKRCHKSFIE